MPSSGLYGHCTPCTNLHEDTRISRKRWNCIKHRAILSSPRGLNLFMGSVSQWRLTSLVQRQFIATFMRFSSFDSVVTTTWNPLGDKPLRTPVRDYQTGLTVVRRLTLKEASTVSPGSSPALHNKAEVRRVLTLIALPEVRGAWMRGEEHLNGALTLIAGSEGSTGTLCSLRPNCKFNIIDHFILLPPRRPCHDRLKLQAPNKTLPPLIFLVRILYHSN